MFAGADYGQIVDANNVQANSVWCGPAFPPASPKPFVVYHCYADHSGSGPNIIYIGSDKSAAFDALMKFLQASTAYGSEIQIKEQA